MNLWTVLLFVSCHGIIVVMSSMYLINAIIGM